MPASKSKRRGGPKQKAGPRRPNLKKKRAQLDGQFSHFLTMAKSQEADEDYVREVLASPESLLIPTEEIRFAKYFC